jgi:hypothetical protein
MEGSNNLLAGAARSFLPGCPFTLTLLTHPPIITKVRTMLKAEIETPFGPIGRKERRGMKAQHRKELQTNALADRMGRLIESAKAGPNQTMLIIGGVILVILLIIFGWRYYSKVSSQTRSDLWLKVEEASDLEDIEKIAKESPNTVPGRVARLQWARTLYRQGIEKLYSVTDRDNAQKNLEDARNLYDQLAKELTDSPVMVQEAMMGSAKARESLGDLDSATAAYNKLAKDFPKSALGKEAEDRAKQLQDKGTEIKDFYTELNKLADSKK